MPEGGKAEMRIRFRFAKLGKIRFTSQRDVARMWERALRRAELPLAYTEGFSPRPQLSFGLALPTGCESLAEYLDVVLDDNRPETAEVDVSRLPAGLTGLLPAGIVVEEAAVVERRSESLQQVVTSCSWTMEFGGVSRADLAEPGGRPCWRRSPFPSCGSARAVRSATICARPCWLWPCAMPRTGARRRRSESKRDNEHGVAPARSPWWPSWPPSPGRRGPSSWSGA